MPTDPVMGLPRGPALHGRTRNHRAAATVRARDYLASANGGGEVQLRRPAVPVDGPIGGWPIGLLPVPAPGEVPAVYGWAHLPPFVTTEEDGATLMLDATSPRNPTELLGWYPDEGRFVDGPGARYVRSGQEIDTGAPMHRYEHEASDLGRGLRAAFIVDAGRKPDGARRQIKRMGFDSRGEAEEVLSELLASVHAGTWVPPSRLSVGEYLLDRWLPRTRTGAKTRADRELHMRVYVVPRIGGLTLEELSGDDLTFLHDHLAVRGRTRAPHPEFGQGLSPTTVRRIHTMLHKAFADAIRWGLLERNPCDRADPPSTSEVKGRARSARHTYTWDDLGRFLEVASDDRLFAMWHLFVTTGMRRSEVAALMWRNLDLETGLLSVTRAAVEVKGKVDERELTKSSSSRRAIELAEQDVAVLRQHRKMQLEEQIALHGSWREPERVFTSPVGGRLYPPDITRAFHVLTNRAGLQRIRLHDLRHTFATLSLKSGEPAKIVTERLGHSTTAYTQDAYQEVMPGMQRDAARRFGQRLQRPPATSNDGDAPDEQDVP
jgi:integrase